MKLSLSALSLSLVLVVPPVAFAQVPPEKAVSTLKIVDGLQIELWASEPLFVNPTCCDVDHKGRVWVCDSVNYRHQLHRRPPNRKEGDRIVILEDTTGSGKADKATTFYQAPDFLAPLGIAVAKDPKGPGYKVFVCHSPHIYVFEDADGDGKADGPPKKFLSGFGGYDHDHGVHGILIGPDGKLYFSVGDTGVHGLQSSNGKGRKWESNGTDCRAGTIWRCDLDGTHLELIAHNFRNEYEPCVDSFGTVFVSDNDDDGNQQTRICYVMPGGNYGYHPRGPGQTHWHEEQPGVVPKILRTYFGSPTGICVYEGTLLPKQYQGQLLHTDAGPRHVRCYHLTPDGAGYAVDREDMVTSTDNWFRPSDVCVAPDGSVFVADWYDPGVGGHGMGDTTRGRLFRITPTGHKGYQIPEVNLKTTEGVLAALGSPNLAVRYMAMSHLKALLPQERRPILEAALKQKDNPFLRARALWQFTDPAFRHGLVGKVLRALQDEDTRFRIQAVRILREAHNRRNESDGEEVLTPEILKELVDDPSAAVRRETLLMLRDLPAAEAKEAVYALARKHDGKDRFYLEAIGIAVNPHDAARRQQLLGEFDRAFPGWDDRVIDLVWELQPEGALPLLVKKLADSKLTAAQRGRIVDILGTARGRGTAEALLEALRTEMPADVRAKLVDNVERLLASEPALHNAPALTPTIDHLMGFAASRPAALRLIAAANGVEAVARVTGLIGDDTQPDAVRREAVRTLGRLLSQESVKALTPLVQKRTGLTEDALQALGALAVRPGAVADKALDALQGVVLDRKAAMESRTGALAALAGTRPGSVWLLAIHERGGLDAALKPDVARLLRNSPYQDLRNKAMIAFPPPGRIDPKKLPSIATLAARRGDPARGRQVLAASATNDMQCLKCHTVHGVGGSVGPDLSMIGKKASKENLFESILYPSKAIADQYINWQVETTKGLSLSGLLVEETADFVTLRDGNGKDTRIGKKEIESRTRSAKSLMPEDLVVYLTEDDLIDLVAHLQELKTASLTPDVWHIIGPFDNGVSDAGLETVYPPEKAIDLKERYKGKLGEVRWRTVRPDLKGYVDLAAFFAGHSEEIVSYSYQEIESPQDQEGTILLGSDDGCKLWFNGKLVHTSTAHRAAVPGQETIKVPLRKGVNRILLKVNNGGGPHGFYFTLLAEQELKRVATK
jgi:putative membrane-bound dehydrogenase-like protein